MTQFNIVLERQNESLKLLRTMAMNAAGAKTDSLNEPIPTPCDNEDEFQTLLANLNDKKFAHKIVS